MRVRVCVCDGWMGVVCVRIAISDLTVMVRSLL